MGSKFLTIFIFILVICLSVLLFSGCNGEEAATVTEEVKEEEIKAEEPETAKTTAEGNVLIDGMIGEGEYSGNVFDGVTGIDLYYSVDDMFLYIGIKSNVSGWVSIGFDPEFAMKDADIIFMAIEGGELIMRDDFGTGSFSHSSDEDLGGSFDIKDSIGIAAGNGAIYEFIKPLDSGDEFDKILAPGNKYKIIFGVNENTGDFDRKHTLRSSDEIQF